MKKVLIAVAAVMIAVFAAPAFAATNPFMDVPADHWAHDAAAQLASRGVISGYPDGSYKGAQPATRYEMASIIARAMARIDMEKASKQDVEMLKKLIVEFKEELDAIGVKVDNLDERLAVIEKDLGGWSLAGELRFDAKFGSDNGEAGKGWYDDAYSMKGKNEFDLNRYRVFLRKRIDENTSFTARLGRNGENTGNPDVRFERYFVTTKLPYDIKFSAGRLNFNWEDDLGLHHGKEEDAWYGDFTGNYLQFEKTWGMANFQVVVGREYDSGFAGLKDATSGDLKYGTGMEQFMVAAKFGIDINEKLMLGVMGYWNFTDEEFNVPPAVLGVTSPPLPAGKSDTNIATYGAYAGYSFTPAIQLKGVYYLQDQGKSIAHLMSGGASDEAAAWKAILQLDQDLLKFTDLWVEYGHMDNNFVQKGAFGHQRWDGGTSSYAGWGADVFANRPNNDNTAKIMFIRADQKWGDKWRTFGRYVNVDYDTKGLDDAVNWGAGIAYRMNPAIEFELSYDNIDYGNNNGLKYRNGDDNIIRFRTFVTF